MIKTKSALLVLLAAFAFTGCGNNIPHNNAVAPDVLVEESEVCTEVLSSFGPTRLILTTSTAQNTTTTTTTLATTTEARTEAEEPSEVTVESKDIEPECIEESDEVELEQIEESEDVSDSDELEPGVELQEGALIRSGMRGTYYAPGSWNGYSTTGGSGRALLDCNSGGDGYAKGSIASGYLYDLLGYYADGGQTTVWLCVDGYPEMNGLYYLDDCSGADVIDFFYNENDNCQFSWSGVVSVDVYYAD